MEYDKFARSYNELHGVEQLRKLALIKKNLKIGKNDTVLDVGCGSGLSIVLRGSLVGIDPSLGLLRQARFPKVLGVAEYLPFKDKSFDVVMSVTAIHNFADKGVALSEIQRVGRRRFAFTVLRKSRFAPSIMAAIRKRFSVRLVLDDQHDYIVVAS